MFHQPKPDAPRCPACTNAFIYFRVKEENWRCRNCDEIFPSPIRPRARTAGSGNIAPSTYRSQLARERLAASAASILTEGNYYGQRDK